MKTIRFLTAVLALILSSACVPLPSLNPLWDDAHLAPIAELEGSWVSANGNDKLKFAVVDKAKYDVTFTSKEGVSHFDVHSVTISDRSYLDFYPDGDALERRLEGEAYLPLIPTHFFARVKCSGNTLELAVLDDETMDKKVKEGKANIPLVKWSDGVLLTADTPAIQQMLTQIADDPEFWGETESFKRTPVKHQVRGDGMPPRTVIQRMASARIMRVPNTPPIAKLWCSATWSQKNRAAFISR